MRLFVRMASCIAALSDTMLGSVIRLTPVPLSSGVVQAREKFRHRVHLSVQRRYGRHVLCEEGPTGQYLEERDITRKNGQPVHSGVHDTGAFHTLYHRNRDRVLTRCG